MRMTFLAITALIPVLMAGCASSERMSRMSGGVFQEYSAPKANRLQSVAIRSSKTNPYYETRYPALPQTAWTDATPVNAWPFFFRSAYYTSILWPFVDWDDYGFAVRPFYNQEGNERAVLFPLSAWNPANGDGWVLSAAWNRYGFGVIPFFWHHRTGDSFWYHVGPLLIHSADVSPLTPRYYRRKNWFWVFPLYLSRTDQVEKSFSDAFCRKFSPETKQLLAYRLAGTGVAVPGSQEELDRLGNDPETAKKLPLSKTMDLGVPLLFHVSDDSYKTSWRALAYLIGGEDSDKYFAWDVLGPFVARYRNQQSGNYWSRDRLFLSLFLLTYFTHNTSLAEPQANAIQRLNRKLNELTHYKTFEDPAQFRKKIPEINDELKKLNPAWKLPDSVTTREIYRLWLEDFNRGEEFRSLELPVRHSRSGGFLPLFWFNRDELLGERSFFSFAGMTCYYQRGDESLSFWSVPLLTYRSREKYRSGKTVRQEKETFWIVPPLIWYSDMKSNFKPEQHPILPSTVRQAGKYECSVRQNDFSVLGLYYHGKMAFYAAKPGVDNKSLEFLRLNLPSVVREAKELVTSIRKLKQDIAGLQAASERERKLASQPGKDKVRLYEKLLELEKKQLALKKAEQEQAKLRQKVAGLEKKADSIGFKFDAEGVLQGNTAASDAALTEMFARYTEKRWQEDYGSAFFYRKAIFHNGDFHWRLFGILAGGEKNGDREHCHVLQLLYRYRRDGRKMEEIYFPFVSIREDGADRRFSFLGRVYQKTVKNGRTGGYILFIPFGERNQ